MPTIKVADTVFDDPTQNDLNPSSLAVSGGRLMSSSPHIDGLLFAGADVLGKDSTNLVLTRNAKGDWSLNRTAAGAETYNIRITLADMGAMPRIGETYERGGFGSGNNPTAPTKGIRIRDFFAVYKSGVVALTTATLRLGKTVYSSTPAGAVFAQTDLVAATATNTANNANYGYQDVVVPAPVFHVDDLGLVEIELQVVMANTGTVAIAGLGAHVDFNYT